MTLLNPTMEQSASIHSVDDAPFETLTWRMSKSGGGNIMEQTTSKVRRLTPRECERLQGFPDDWTKVPYKGKPAEECPDGPRYKALGNSMAVPVVRWIGERIENYTKDNS